MHQWPFEKLTRKSSNVVAVWSIQPHRVHLAAAALQETKVEQVAALANSSAGGAFTTLSNLIPKCSSFSCTPDHLCRLLLHYTSTWYLLLG